MPSKALPRWMYQDPAKVYESVQNRRIGCKACKSHKIVLGRVMCGDERNYQQQGVPQIGKRCKWFVKDKE
jgi:hypothetical protein